MDVLISIENVSNVLAAITFFTEKVDFCDGLIIKLKPALRPMANVNTIFFSVRDRGCKKKKSAYAVSKTCAS